MIYTFSKSEALPLLHLHEAGVLLLAEGEVDRALLHQDVDRVLRLLALRLGAQELRPGEEYNLVSM